MWIELPAEQRERYKKLITNFASLSEAFAQKEEAADSIVAPIVNSKFQETAFQRCFNAFAEDIANTSYDASINTGDKKYLVGIKTFGLNSGDQKVAQFKSIAGTGEWSKLKDQMQINAKGLKTKEEIDNANYKLYDRLAHLISIIRNKRIASSKANLRGFKLDGTPVEAVYHFLMPSPKNALPLISVGETSYSSINIDNIKVLGCTGARNPQNFTFTDGIHEYKWTSTDSQLLMKFHNKEVILEQWPVHYVDDAFSFFENLQQGNYYVTTASKKTESHSWYLEIQPYSGFNAFMGQPKLPRKNFAREKLAKQLPQKYVNDIGTENTEKLTLLLQNMIIPNWNKKSDKPEMLRVRKKLLDFVKSLNNNDLLHEIQKKVYRPANELELRIPNARKFHNEYPDFFTKNQIFQPNSNKCVKDRNMRTFNLEFSPSGDQIEAYINQDNGKAIESVGKQTTLGKWLLRKVFQLKPYQPLTKQKLLEMGYNGIRLTKTDTTIQLQFIWIDPNNEPDDLWN